VAGRLEHRLDLAHRSFGGLDVAVRQEPARALRQQAAERPDERADRGTDEQADAPPDVDRDQARIEQDRLADGADDRAEPVRPVDREVGAPAIRGGDELVDRGVDGGVLAADAGARRSGRT
jgi:hypothetical protein